MGFVHPIHEGMIEALKVNLDDRGNVDADTEAYQTSRSTKFLQLAICGVVSRLSSGRSVKVDNALVRSMSS